MQRWLGWTCAALIACEADPLPPRTRFADQQLDALDGAALADGATATAGDVTATDGALADAAADVTPDSAAASPAPCAPCSSNSDCPAGSACLDHSGLPAYCGAPCVDGGCTTPGWQCKPRKTVAGGEVPQCAPISDKCPCPVGGPETCNLLDDDCDGSTDESTCADNNPCTDDVCGAEGTCKNPANANLCSDGNDCTIDDLCKAGACTPGVTKACTDGNPCTDDGCTLGNCTHVPHTKPCDDGSLCTAGDACSPQGCKGTAKTCNDNINCTLDECTATTGECVFKPVNATCEDGDACTTNTCSTTKGCQWMPKCDDGNPCTDDACAANGSCSATNKPAQSACTSQGQAGKCNGAGKCCLGPAGSTDGC
jgi:hypothetical protein